MMQHTVTLKQSELVHYPSVHHWLAEKLQLPEYYGCNLDALWDCLTAGLALPLHIVWVHDVEIADEAENLDAFISILEEAAEEVDGLSFQYIHEPHMK